MLDVGLRKLDAVVTRLDHAVYLRIVLFLGGGLIALGFGVTGWLMGIGIFSPDSWAYHELARTVFSDRFFAFNTTRTYFTETYSSSFPLGYPVLVAVANWVFGSGPMAAVWLNISIVVVTWVLIVLLAQPAGVSRFAALVLASSLVLWPPYLDEVFSGRAIPAAVLCFVLAFWAYRSQQVILSGVLLGASALVRFDFLLVALLFLLAVAALDEERRTRVWLISVGLLLGLLPWVAYSYIHFGKFWVSDNSWIALSADSGFVRDYPARAASTIFDDPEAWSSRVIANMVPLGKALWDALWTFPAVLPLAVMAIVFLPSIEASERRYWVTLMVLSLGSVVPYVLTGYFDRRYFALLLLCWSAFAARAILASALGKPRQALIHGVLLATLSLSLGSGGIYLAKASWYSYSEWIEGVSDPDGVRMQPLLPCHTRHPGLTYIFGGKVTYLASRYGATTGMRAAAIPSNLERMSPAQKRDYFSSMEPYRLLNDFNDFSGCPSP